MTICWASFARCLLLWTPEDVCRRAGRATPSPCASPRAPAGVKGGKQVAPGRSAAAPLAIATAAAAPTAGSSCGTPSGKSAKTRLFGRSAAAASQGGAAGGEGGEAQQPSSSNSGSGEDTVERLNRFRKASGRNMRPSLERSVQHNRLQQQGGGQGASSTPTSGVGGVAGGACTTAASAIAAALRYGSPASANGTMGRASGVPPTMMRSMQSINEDSGYPASGHGGAGAAGVAAGAAAVGLNPLQARYSSPPAAQAAYNRSSAAAAAGAMGPGPPPQLGPGTAPSTAPGTGTGMGAAPLQSLGMAMGLPRAQYGTGEVLLLAAGGLVIVFNLAQVCPLMVAEVKLVAADMALVLPRWALATAGFLGLLLPAVVTLMPRQLQVAIMRPVMMKGVWMYCPDMKARRPATDFQLVMGAANLGVKRALTRSRGIAIRGLNLIQSALLAMNLSWFPGHMAKALRQLEQRIKQVDLVLEVRDARVPLSSFNPHLEKLVAAKRRLVLLNKTDLADPAATRAATALLTQQAGLRVLPCEALDGRSAGRVLDAVLDCMRSGRAPSPTTATSLINALRRAAAARGLLDGEQAWRKAARSGPLPGVTTALGGFRVCRSPAGAGHGAAHNGAGASAQHPTGRTRGLRPDPGHGAGVGPGDGDLGQLLMSDPRRLRELWCAADSQLLQQARGGGAAEAARWHPAREAHVSAAEADARVEALLRRLTNGHRGSSATGGGGAVVNAGQRTAAQRAVLIAFRSGALGRYTWDDGRRGRCWRHPQQSHLPRTAAYMRIHAVVGSSAARGASTYASGWVMRRYAIVCPLLDKAFIPDPWLSPLFFDVKSQGHAGGRKNAGKQSMQ
eukprot:XP_001700290.1 predicted protein [Chlamydomonas reinhardtii]